MLLDWLGLSPSASTVLFHRDDPQTSKTCPGTKVEKAWVLGLIRGATEEPDDTTHPKPAIEVTLKSSDRRFEGEQWCIPVLTYLGKKGISTEQVAAKLEKRGKEFYYDGEWLEGAFYDSGTESTWAPVRELTDLV